jgi:16S rRNA processing protein RimM
MVSPRPTISREQKGLSVSRAPTPSTADDSARSDTSASGRKEGDVGAGKAPVWVQVARLTRPHGRRGELIAEILTDFPERFHQRPRLFLIPPERIGSRPRAIQMENFWFLRSRVVMKFRGVDSINEAEALRGFAVAIPAAERVTLAAGSVYISDLIGCGVVDLNRDGTLVGTVVDVDRASSSTELLVVKGSGREGAAELLIPFVAEYLVRMDAAHRRLEMRLPEGLLEINRPMTDEEKREAAGSR